MANALLDQNSRPALTAVSNADSSVIVPLYADPITHRLLVDLSASSGTVTSVSVVSANGFAGTVATATTTPAITLSTTITGVLKGNGTAISAASAGTDYVAPGAITTSGLTMATAKVLGRATAGTGAIEEIAVTGSGSVVLATSPTLVTPVLGVATATSVNGLVISTTTGTFTLTNGKTFAVTNGLTLSGTDSTVMTFPTTSATVARTDAANTFTGASTTSAWVMTSPTITTSIVPTNDDGAALGSTSKEFADLFLASGGVINWANGNATLTHSSGLLTSNVALSLGTSNAFTTGTIELGAASDTTISRSSAGVIAVEGVVIPSISSTNTFTNKFNTPQVQSVGDAGGTLTPVSITNDVVVATALSQATTIAAPTGSPVQGETLVIRLKDNGTARALTWNAIYRASSDLALPTTTVLSKTLYCGFMYNSTDTKWDLLAYLNNI